jgi:hypothetical protein
MVLNPVERNKSEKAILTHPNSELNAANAEVRKSKYFCNY